MSKVSKRQESYTVLQHLFVFIYSHLHFILQHSRTRFSRSRLPPLPPFSFYHSNPSSQCRILIGSAILGIYFCECSRKRKKSLFSVPPSDRFRSFVYQSHYPVFLLQWRRNTPFYPLRQIPARYFFGNFSPSHKPTTLSYCVKQHPAAGAGESVIMITGDSSESAKI